MSFFGVTDTPVLYFWWCLLRFQSQSGQPYEPGGFICDIWSLNFTSGVTPFAGVHGQHSDLTTTQLDWNGRPPDIAARSATHSATATGYVFY